MASLSSTLLLSQIASPTSFKQDHHDAEDSAISTDVSLGGKWDNGDDNNQIEPGETIGHLKGAAIKKQLDKDGRIAAAISDMMQWYRVKQLEVKATGKITKKHMYGCLLKAIQHKYNLPNLTIKKRLIWSHIYCNSLDRGVKVSDTPIKAVEPLLVNVCAQKAKLVQPANITEGILMVDSLIQHTLWQKKLTHYQKWWKMDKDG